MGASQTSQVRRVYGERGTMNSPGVHSHEDSRCQYTNICSICQGTNGRLAGCRTCREAVTLALAMMIHSEGQASGLSLLLTLTVTPVLDENIRPFLSDNLKVKIGMIY